MIISKNIKKILLPGFLILLAGSCVSRKHLLTVKETPVVDSSGNIRNVRITDLDKSFAYSASKYYTIRENHNGRVYYSLVEKNSSYVDPTTIDPNKDYNPFLLEKFKFDPRVSFTFSQASNFVTALNTAEDIFTKVIASNSTYNNKEQICPLNNGYVVISSRAIQNKRQCLVTFMIVKERRGALSAVNPLSISENRDGQTNGEKPLEYSKFESFNFMKEVSKTGEVSYDDTEILRRFKQLFVLP